MYLPYNKVATSKAAAKKAKPIARGQKREILKFILTSDTEGFTAQEIAKGTGISDNSVRPRLLCLEKEGSIKRSGKTRKTASGREAEVWVACDGASKRIK